MEKYIVFQVGTQLSNAYLSTLVVQFHVDKEMSCCNLHLYKTVWTNKGSIHQALQHLFLLTGLYCGVPTSYLIWTCVYNRARWDIQLQNQNPSTWIWKENLILKLFCSFKFFDLSAPSAVPGHFWWIFTFLFSLTWSETAYHFITIVTPFHHCYPTYDK